MSNILLVEDEHSLREIITFNLKNAGHEVVDTDNANDALIIIEDFIPEIILLDIMLPGLKGAQFLNLIRSNPKYHDIPVIIISAKSSEDDIVRLLEAGADDYLTKPFSIKVLLAKIKVMMKRSPMTTDKKIIEYHNILVDENNYRVYCNNSEITLTHKEFELLTLFLKHPRRVFTRNQLLSTVWGYESDVFTRTVDSHISSLRKKLGEKGNIIKSIPKIGYKVE
ncbi:response regulator [Flexistipes sinusarabici]|uniref:response regulator n=1 Tax=Flexistipes sinusarabici TaxID=2352 RepID=UPI002352474D|nr:response regulator [Flexistipes sinusarabici]